MINIETIKKLSTARSFQRGMEYYNSGRVLKIDVLDNKILAEVAGASIYKLVIKINSAEDITASCSCPYDFGGFCKHIVAVLISLTENYNDLNSIFKLQQIKEKEINKRIEDILINAPQEKIREFLIEECRNDYLFRENFLIFFSGSGSKMKSMDDYKEEINALYNAVSYRGLIQYGIHPDFSEVYNLAEWYSSSENFTEAITIYQAIFEVISENMDRVDDSDGFYDSEFTTALDLYIETINRAGLPIKARKYYISYLFQKYIEKNSDDMQEHYNYALKKICKHKEEFLFWDKLLKPYTPLELPDEDDWAEYYAAKQLILTRLFLLDKLNKKQEYYDLVEKFYKKDEQFCEEYVYRLFKDKRKDGAIKIAEKGVKLFKDHLTKKLRRFLNLYYKKDNPEKYKENLIFLFSSSGNWKYYEKLKRFCKKEEWQEMFPSIIKKVSRHSFDSKDMIIRLYLKEEIFDKAIEKLLCNCSLETLDSFQKDLADRFPDTYFSAYKRLIIPFANSKAGRAHYRTVIQYLGNMKKIKGFENEFSNLILNMKEKYKNRPAFLDELKFL